MQNFQKFCLTKQDIASLGLMYAIRFVNVYIIRFVAGFLIRLLACDKLANPNYG